MSSSEAKLEFRATGGDCAGFLLTRILLTVLTCGIYGFWLASDWKRWIASKTFVHGEPLVYKTSFADFVLNQLVKGALLLATCGIYLPWAKVKGDRYDWRHTVVSDGRTCRFDGDGAGYVGTAILGALLALCTCGFGSPWAIAMKARWNWAHTLIGGERVRFEGQVGDLVLKVIGGQVLTMLTGGIYLPWHLVNLMKWRIENAVVARGTETDPVPADPLEQVIARYAADRRTWYALGGVAATLVLLVILGKGVDLVRAQFAGDSPKVQTTQQAVVLAKPEPSPAQPPVQSTGLATPSWVICVGAFPTKSDAEATASKIRAKGFDTGVLWIPDYGSLSGAKMYVAYVGPVSYASRADAESLLRRVQKAVASDAYAVKIDSAGPREEIR